MDGTKGREKLNVYYEDDKREEEYMQKNKKYSELIRFSGLIIIVQVLFTLLTLRAYGQTVSNDKYCRNNLKMETNITTSSQVVLGKSKDDEYGDINNIIKDIYVEDLNGNIIGTTETIDISKLVKADLYSGVKLRYVLNIYRDLEETKYKINIPNEFLIDRTISCNIMSDYITVGTVTFYENHDAVIEFQKDIMKYDMQGEFYLNTHFDVDAIDQFGDENSIKFRLPGGAVVDIPISVDKDNNNHRSDTDDESKGDAGDLDKDDTEEQGGNDSNTFQRDDISVIQAEIQGDGRYDPEKKEIVWGIGIWPHSYEDNPFKDVCIKDKLAPNQEYVEGSVQMNPYAAMGDYKLYYDKENRTIIIKNLEFANNEYAYFTFRTKISDDMLKNGGTIYNSPYLQKIINKKAYRKLQKDPAVVSLKSGQDFIRIDGDYFGDDKLIWKMTIDGDSLPLSQSNFTETFPNEYMSLYGSIKVDGQVIKEGTGENEYEYTPPNDSSPGTLKINFGDINSKHIVEFITGFNEKFYNGQQMINCKSSASLQVNSGEDYEEYSAESNDLYIGSYPLTTMIITSGDTFTYAEHTYRWQSTINYNNIKMKNIVFKYQFEQDIHEFLTEDKIRIRKMSPEDKDHKYVEIYFIKDDTASNDEIVKYKISDIYEEGGYDKNEEYKGINFDVQYDKSTNSLMVKDNGETNCSYLVYYNTKLINQNYYAGNDEVSHSFKSYLSWNDGTCNCDSDWPINYTDLQYIKNTAENYDLENHTIKWKVLLNKNKLNLKNAVLSENIPKGQKYVEGTFKIERDNSDNEVISGDIDNVIPGTFHNEVYEKDESNEYSCKISYDFGDKVIKDSYVITFETQITGEAFLNASGKDITVNNTAVIDAKDAKDNDKTLNTVKSTGEIKIPSSSIIKNGVYGTDGQRRWIDWNIIVNSNFQELQNASVEDEFENGLDYDSTTLKVYNAIISDVGYDVGSEYSQINSKFKDGKLTVYINSDYDNKINSPYVIKFRTYVSDPDKCSYSNVAYLLINGNAVAGQRPQSATASGTMMSAGGLVSIKNGIIRIINKDDFGNNVENSQFEVCNLDTNEVSIVTTDSNGIAELKNIPYGRYEIKQKICPEGYQLNIEIKNVEISTDNKQVQEEFVNNKKLDPILKLRKLIINVVDSDNMPLKGAEFEVYMNDNGSIIDKKITDKDGRVCFEDLGEGKYYFIESKEPDGYIKIDNKFDFDICESSPDEILLIVRNLKDTPKQPEIMTKNEESKDSREQETSTKKDIEDTPKAREEYTDSNDKDKTNKSIDVKESSNIEKNKTMEHKAEKKKEPVDKGPSPVTSNYKNKLNEINNNEKELLTIDNNVGGETSEFQDDDKNKFNDTYINYDVPEEGYLLEDSVVSNNNEPEEFNLYKDKVKWVSSLVEQKASELKEVFETPQMKTGFAFTLGGVGILSVALTKKNKLKLKDFLKGILVCSRLNKYMLTVNYDDENGWNGEKIIKDREININDETEFKYDKYFSQRIKVYKGEKGKINIVQSTENLERLNKMYKEVCIPELDIDFMNHQIKRLIRVNKRAVRINPNEYAEIIIEIMATQYDETSYVPNKYKLFVKYDQYENKNVSSNMYITDTYLYLEDNMYDKQVGLNRALWFDEKKYLQESGIINVMFVINNVIFTSKLNFDAIPTIMRGNVLAIAKDMNMEIEEKNINLSSIMDSISNNTLSEIILIDVNEKLRYIKAIYYDGMEYNLNNREIFDKINRRIKMVNCGEIDDGYNWVTHLK